MLPNNPWRPRTAEELQKQQQDRDRQIREDIIARANPVLDRNVVRGYN